MENNQLEKKSTSKNQHFRKKKLDFSKPNFGDFIKGKDYFPQPVSLSVYGDFEVKTRASGYLSIFMYFIVIILALQGFVQLTKRNDTTSTIVTT